MDIKVAKSLREKWGDKPCEHLSFEKETQGQVLLGGYVEQKTGDYVCTQCGECFTEKEKKEIESKRNL